MPLDPLSEHRLSHSRTGYHPSEKGQGGPVPHTVPSVRPIRRANKAAGEFENVGENLLIDGRERVLYLLGDSLRKDGILDPVLDIPPTSLDEVAGEMASHVLIGVGDGTFPNSGLSKPSSD